MRMRFISYAVEVITSLFETELNRELNSKLLLSSIDTSIDENDFFPRSFNDNSDSIVLASNLSFLDWSKSFEGAEIDKYEVTFNFDIDSKLPK